jgi:hypothetical protein
MNSFSNYYNISTLFYGKYFVGRVMAFCENVCVGFGLKIKLTLNTIDSTIILN